MLVQTRLERFGHTFRRFPIHPFKSSFIVQCSLVFKFIRVDPLGHFIEAPLGAILQLKLASTCMRAESLFFSFGHFRFIIIDKCVERGSDQPPCHKHTDTLYCHVSSVPSRSRKYTFLSPVFFPSSFPDLRRFWWFMWAGVDASPPPPLRPAFTLVITTK